VGKVVIDLKRDDLQELDKLGEAALKSPTLMNLIVNGATLMGVKKDILRGVIRKLIGQPEDKVQKALEIMCEHVEECPLSWGCVSMKWCKKCDGENAKSCWYRYYIEKAERELGHD